jgi:hypothetical protein
MLASGSHSTLPKFDLLHGCGRRSISARQAWRSCAAMRNCGSISSWTLINKRAARRIGFGQLGQDLWIIG